MKVEDHLSLETPFTDRNRALGGKIVDFAGYLMPLQFAGQLKEHEAVRTGVGLFDLSHMGEFHFSGPGALEFTDHLLTNQLSAKEPGGIVYSPMCRPDGGIVDDVLAYRREDGVLLVVNAANIEKDLEWVRSHAPEGMIVHDRSADTALLAIQGPKAGAVVKPFTGDWITDLGYYHFREFLWDGVPVLISRTGYTGEDGFELFFDRRHADTMWERIQEAGKPHDMAPIGLAARDTLRLEVGYCLYGNDIDDTTTPLEAGLQWTVKLDKPDFIGKDALVTQKAAGLRRKLMGLTIDQAGMIPRAGMNVLTDGTVTGRVTSGTMSPSLKKSIAMAYVPIGSAKPGSEVQVDIRGRTARAVVQRLPFYTEGTRKS
ncbi:MAG TPA: glycine cleavage system aminomethyltransferase GcvT [Candidatus Eisenbacteria bacterium]